MFGDRPQDRPNVQLEREFDRPLTPRERAAVRKAVKIASRGAAARRRKEDARQRLAAKIRSGEYVSPADLKNAQAAGVNFGTHGLVGKTVKGLAESAEYALPGLYETGKAAALDTRDIARAIGGREGGDLTPSRSAKIAKAVGEGVGESFAHPGRHPDQTILNVLAALSLGAGTAARLGAAGAAAREGGLGAALARPGYEGGSLLRKPVPPIRKVRVGDTEFQGTYSKNAARQMVQQAMDRRAERRAAAGKPEALNARAARFGSRQRMIEEDTGRAPEMTVRAAGRKLTPGQNMALRAIVEQTPLSDRLALAQAQLGRAKTPRARARLRREIGLIRAAEPYVKTAADGSVEAAAEFRTPRRRGGLPAANAVEFQAQVDRVVRGGARREAQGEELGLLTPETIEARKTQPQRIAQEAARPTADQAQARVAAIEQELQRNPKFKEAVDSVYPPEYRKQLATLRNAYKGAKGKRAQRALDMRIAELEGRSMRGTGSVPAAARENVADAILRAAEREGVEKLPPWAREVVPLLREREALRGKAQANTSRVAATGMAAMNRLHLAVRNSARLFGAGVKARPADTFRTKYVPVRDRDLSPQAMSTLRALQEKAENEKLTGAERDAYERALRELAPEVDVDALDAPTGAEIDGVRWVPKRIFDRVTSEGAQFTAPASPTARTVAHVWREFNSGLRAMVLYSKGGGAAYITPNLAANVLLLAFQGGPKMIGAAVRSLNPRFRAAVGEDAWHAGLARMGEGFMTSTFAERAGRGVISATTQAWSKALGKVTDEQTRMASLVYEAAERGYKTPEQFRSLMLDPKHADEAMDVTIRARDAALDYALMSPAEKSLISSWLFVYPFIRASSRYAVNFPLDHPFQAATYAQLAQIALGSEGLGERGLTRDAGLVQVGSRTIPGAGELPVVSNVNALGPFTSLPEMVQVLKGAVGTGKGPARGQSIADVMNPALTAALETLTGADSFTGAPVERNIGGFLGQVADELPLVRDVRQLQKSPEEIARQTSPREARDVLTGEVLGSVAPHPYNPAKADEYRQRDRLSNLGPAQRARVQVFAERQTIYETMRKDDPQLLDDTGRLPEPVRQAYNRAADVEAARAAARDAAGDDSLAYYRQVAVSEARLYESWGVVPRGFAADVARLVKTATLDKLRSGVRRMRDDYAPDAYRDITSEGRKYLERRTS